MESKKKTKKIIIVLVFISIILIGIISASFFLFFKEQKQNVKQVIKTGVVSLNYKTKVNGISLYSLTPISNEVAKENREPGSYFDFSVISEVAENTTVDYEIALIKDESSTISDSDIIVYLEKQNNGSYSKVEDPIEFTPIKKKSKLGSPAMSMILNKVSLSSNQVDNYRLRFWVREGATISDPNSTYKVRVNVYGKAS